MRLKSRFISLVALIALVATVVPAGSASGVVVSSESGSSAVPLQLPIVRTVAREGGVQVLVARLAPEVTGFDVYRSEAAGVEGAKVNDEPVRGTRYFDATALPGVQYHYTIKVAGRLPNGRAPKSRQVTPDVLPQVAGAIVRETPDESVEVVSDVVAAQSPDQLLARKASAVGQKKSASKPAPESVVSAIAAKTYGSAGAPTTLASSTTWSPSGGPYFIRGDLIVPVGKTLTILPGTKVYFDTVASGVATTSPRATVSSATERVDIIVHGKIVANGTSTRPILFTSVRSTLPSGTLEAAQSGDWGCVFVDSRAASSVSYCEFEYGRMGVWAHNTLRPYVKYSTFRYCASLGYLGAICFTNPPAPDLTTARISIVGNRIYAPLNGEGIDVHWTAYGTNSLDRVVDPYIAGNTVTGPWPLEMYSWEASPHAGSYGHMYVKGTISNNTFLGTSGSAVAVEVISQGAAKHATISTSFSGNTISNSPDAGAGLRCTAYAYGDNASAYVKPRFSKDRIVARNLSAGGVSLYAGSTSGAGTSIGQAQVAPTFAYCDVRSAWDAVQINTWTGARGTAMSAGTFTGGFYQSTGQSSFRVSSDSSAGAASTMPSFTSTTARSWNALEALYASARTNGSATANCSPKWTGGSAWSSDDALYARAMSLGGSANANPSVTNAELRAEETCVDARAQASYGGTGSGKATASPVISGCDLIANEFQAVSADAEALAFGSAVSTPVIKSSSLVAEQYYGVESNASSYGGASTASPSLTDSTIWAYNAGVYANAWRGGSGSVIGNATASPRLVRVTDVTKNDDGVFVAATNDGVGASSSRPYAYYSDIVSSSDFSAFSVASGAANGAAVAAPMMTGSNLKSDLSALNVESSSRGSNSSADTSGTLTSCTLSSSFADGYRGVSSAVYRATTSPVFSNCIVEAPDGFAYDADAYCEGTMSTGDYASARPTVSGGKIAHSGDGVRARTIVPNLSPDADAYTTLTLKNAPVVSQWGFGVETEALNYSNGAAYNKSSVTNCPITSREGVLHAVDSQGTVAGNVYNYAKTSGLSSTRRAAVSSTNGDGVACTTYSKEGQAYDRTQTRYLSVSAAQTGIRSTTDAPASGQSVSAAPVISGNVVTVPYGASFDAIRVHASVAEAVVATASPAVTGNTTSGGSAGINVMCGGPGVASPTISSNTVSRTGSNGISVAGTAGKPSITRNNVTATGANGIRIAGPRSGTVSQNKVTEPGVLQAGVNGEGSCLVWNDADHATASVAYNVFAGARGMGVLYTGGAPKTTYNYFVDSAGRVNRPYNYGTTTVATTTATPYDARFNWWGTTSSSVISGTVSIGDVNGVAGYSGPKSDIVNFSSPLPSLRPRVSSISVRKYTTRVKFTVRFDRPMDRSVRRLYFGPRSPYRAYYVTGTWSTDGRTFTGTRARAGLPVRRTMYFSGAKDLTGGLVLSTTKGFRL